MPLAGWVFVVCQVALSPAVAAIVVRPPGSVYNGRTAELRFGCVCPLSTTPGVLSTVWRSCRVFVRGVDETLVLLGGRL